MNLKKISIIIILCFFLILLIPCCKALVWDPSGNWTLTATYLAGPTTQTETVVLTGGENSGTVSGLYVGVDPVPTGIYTKTGDWGITFLFDFWDSGLHFVFTYNGDSSEGDPNQITGTGTFHINNILFSQINWNATKITNQQ